MFMKEELQHDFIPLNSLDDELGVHLFNCLSPYLIEFLHFLPFTVNVEGLQPIEYGVLKIGNKAKLTSFNLSSS